jgi:uncharacterized membrane protein
MVNEEEKDPNKEGELKREKHPLSPADWIMFLSGEISDCRTYLSTFEAVIIACLVTCFGCLCALAVIGTIMPLFATCMFFVLMVVLAGMLSWKRPKFKTTIRYIEEIREDIIYGKLKNYEDILKRCEDAGIVKCKKD